MRNPFRRPRFDLGTYSPPDSWPEPSVADTVSEAMIIARAAVRLGVKNLIIVRALQDRADYSVDYLTQATREEFLNLAAEKEADGIRIEGEYDAAVLVDGRATSVADYRAVDGRTLARRAAVMRELAMQLRDDAENHELATSLIDAARQSALDEVLNAYPGAKPRPRSRNLFDHQYRLSLLADDLEELAQDHPGDRA